MTDIGRMVQYRLSQTTADQFTNSDGVSRRYTPGELLPAVVLTVRPGGRCDLHVFLHGPATAYLPAVPEHYAADGAWIPIPGR